MNLPESAPEYIWRWSMTVFIAQFWFKIARAQHWLIRDTADATLINVTTVLMLENSVTRAGHFDEIMLI